MVKNRTMNGMKIPVKRIKKIARRFWPDLLIFAALKSIIMNFPANLRYTKDHEWISLQGNIATIGITDFAQQGIG